MASAAAVLPAMGTIRWRTFRTAAGGTGPPVTGICGRWPQGMSHCGWVKGGGGGYVGNTVGGTGYNGGKGAPLPEEEPKFGKVEAAEEAADETAEVAAMIMGWPVERKTLGTNSGAIGFNPYSFFISRASR